MRCFTKDRRYMISDGRVFGRQGEEGTSSDCGPASLADTKRVRAVAIACSTMMRRAPSLG